MVTTSSPISIYNLIDLHYWLFLNLYLKSAHVILWRVYFYITLHPFFIDFHAIE